MRAFTGSMFRWFAKCFSVVDQSFVENVQKKQGNVYCPACVGGKSFRSLTFHTLEKQKGPDYVTFYYSAVLLSTRVIVCLVLVEIDFFL